MKRMSLRALLTTVLLVVLFAGVGSVLLSLTLIEERVLALFSPETMSQAAAALNMLFIEQTFLTVVFSLFLAGVVFWIISVTLVRPLRIIGESVEGFTLRGEPIQFPRFRGAPKEVKGLASTIQSFSESVVSSHKRDMEISRVKSDFISTAAHQIRTPLTGIRWALEALQKEPLTDTQQEIVKSALDKSRDLVGVVGTLLDISSIESGKYKYVFEPTDMRALVTKLAADFSQLATSGQVSLFYADDGAELPRARADKERITWVLNNLIENAIRYTPAGGTVRITTETGPGRVYVKVQDTGIGIPAQDEGNIFERFYRAPNAIAKQNQGNGLGLYIARTIATDHGGDLNFRTNGQGPGTTFTLSLPIAA